MAAPEASSIVLALNGPIARPDIEGLCERVHDLLEVSGAELVVCDAGALVQSDAVTVDALARVQLTARRLGRRTRLRHASADLQGLLTLMGLCDVMPLDAGLVVQPRGQTEDRKQARRV